MKEKIKKTWDELIEEMILGYKKWWKQDTKERIQKLLHLALKRKYEYKNNKVPLTKEELKFFKSKTQ